MNRYPIPLYLNQKYVFDILAMMEGGLSQLETIKTTQTGQHDFASRHSADIGVKNVFALLGVSLGGERSKKEQTSESQEVTSERVHTPNSLFARMREQLHAENLICTRLSDCQPGSFVEFQIRLQKSPLIDALESIKSLGTMALVFAEYPTQNPNAKKNSKQDDPNMKILQQISTLLEQLNGEGTFDLLGTKADEDSVRIVLTVDRAFLSDPSLSDIVDGEYTVLGKITKVISDHADEKINLLRKSGLGRVQGQVLRQMMSAFDEIRQQGFDLPPIITEIQAPAVQIIPISIFA
jgi:hypothetical protein